MNTTRPQSTVSMDAGTRYRSVDPGSPLPTTELVVERTIRDELGILHVVVTDLDGREISLFAEQFEAAVASGMLATIEEQTLAYA